MGYQPIENYGIIGNMRTAALCGLDGSIDWFCYPRFDSPSVFGAILDDVQAGRFSVTPEAENITYRQLYWPETNVLITRFLAPDGVAELHDFMPIPSRRTRHAPALIRRLHVVRGQMSFRMECRPAFNYARDPHEVHFTEHGAVFESPGLTLQLASNIPLEGDDGAAVARFTLQSEEQVVLGLREVHSEAGTRPVPNEEADELFEHTIEYWRRWLSRCTYAGRWREMVHRSALVLKLLTYEPTGAIVAAPTTSLPEMLGGGRNWDYRYTWVRDAAFILYALLRIGFTEEAARFVEWLEARCHEPPHPEQPLQVMYGIDGRQNLTEETLDHLGGYRGSSPVRIGNGAYNQLQLDIYGELMDSIYLFNKHATPISYDLWTHLRGLVNWVCDHWHRKDQGIWEIRNGKQHFLYSKLMCWVTIDRGLRLAEKRSFPADRGRWLKERDKVYEQIMNLGWSPQRKSFVQAYDSRYLDASSLIMPLVFFLSPTDPRMLQTMEAIRRSPEKDGLLSDSLVYRYDPEKTPDGQHGSEGTFNMCTFWLVEALTRAGASNRRLLRDARLMFEQMLTYANHLGLYAEETGHSGEALGNFPQGFTHLSLISAAFNLDRALDTRQGIFTSWRQE